MSDKNKDESTERVERAYYENLGRRVEVERKAKQEVDAKQAAEDADNERIGRVVAKALLDDEKRQREEAKAKLRRAFSAGLTGAAVMGFAMFYATLLEEEANA